MWPLPPAPLLLWSSIRKDDANFDPALFLDSDFFFVEECGNGEDNRCCLELEGDPIPIMEELAFNGDGNRGDEACLEEDASLDGSIGDATLGVVNTVDVGETPCNCWTCIPLPLPNIELIPTPVSVADEISAARFAIRWTSCLCFLNISSIASEGEPTAFVWLCRLIGNWLMCASSKLIDWFSEAEFAVWSSKKPLVFRLSINFNIFSPVTYL